MSAQQFDQPLLVQPAPMRRIDPRQLEYDAINRVQCTSDSIYHHPHHHHHQQPLPEYAFAQEDVNGYYYYYPSSTSYYLAPPAPSSTPYVTPTSYHPSQHLMLNVATGTYEPIPYTTPDSSASNTPHFVHAEPIQQHASQVVPPLLLAQPTVAQQRFYGQSECYYPPQEYYHHQSPPSDNGVPQLSLAAHIQHAQASSYLPLSPVSPVQQHHQQHHHQYHPQLQTAPSSPQSQSQTTTTTTTAHPHQLHTPAHAHIQQTHSFIPHDATASSSPSSPVVAEDERLKKLRERRHVVACLFCRGRKIACHPPAATDGGEAKAASQTSRATPAANRPSCDNCIKRGRQCVYPERATPRAPRRRRRGAVYDEQDQ